MVFLVKLIQKVIQPWANRLMNLVSFGVVRRADNSGETQTVQAEIREGLSISDIPVMEPYGFTSGVKIDSEVLLVSLGGNRGNTAAVVVGGRAYRLKGLKEGEVALYDDSGQEIILRKDGIEITAPNSLKISGDVAITGKLDVSGVSAAEDHVSGTISGKGHVHTELGDGVDVSVPK